MVLNYRMRFYLILFFCGLVFLVGCTDNKGVPDGIIKEHQMSLLLTDIHLVDGRLYNLPPVPDTLVKHGLGLYLAVFKLHHTDTNQFKASLKYYSTRPDMLNDIYTGITTRLDSLQQARAKQIAAAAAKKAKASQKTTKQLTDSITKAQAKEKHKADSVKTAKKADSVRAARFKNTLLKNTLDNKKAKADSVRKAKKHKHHKKVKPAQPATNAVSN